jgi:O-antigen ligase
LLLGVTAFAFLLGVGRGYTTQTAHDYAKFVLAVGMFWLTLQLVRGLADAARLLKLLLAGVTAAAALALALYAAGPSVTTNALTHLVPYGYPGSRIVRYIEDDPARPMRAVGTSVDPNSFGGLLMVGFVLAIGQLLARRRVVPPWAAGGATVLCGAVLLLTYSRGAWVGAFVGAGLIVVARRPKLVAPLGLLAAAGLALGAGSGFAQRLWLGFTLQDPATKLRLAEYRNAWAIIRQHPWFGVGFGNAGSINLQTGVSSIYLTIAEQAGLVGLMAFALVAGVVVWRAARGFWASERATRRGGPTCPPAFDSHRRWRGRWRGSTPISRAWNGGRTRWSSPTSRAQLSAMASASATAEDAERSELLLSFLAAFVACLTVGLVDHYFFNPQFPQMAALLWILAGALVALTHPTFVAASTDARRTLAATRTAHDGRGATRHGIQGTRRRAGADRDAL